MSAHLLKKTLLVGAVIVLAVLAGLGWARYLLLHMHVALGEEQIGYFVEAVNEAKAKGIPEEIPGYIHAVTNYYPAGTKQRAGSHVDQMVEKARSLAIQELTQQETIFDLKKAAGQTNGTPKSDNF